MQSASGPLTAGGGGAPGGLRIAFEHYHRIEEAEQTMVRAAATVTMEDGSTRSVQLELAMSRRFVQEHLTRVNVVLGERPVDPLVITLAPQGARFGPGVLHFDLDLDGSPDTVRMTAGPSAYLVDDRDGNGAITDGSELFGPRTGDGFAELAALDEDGNGWIDPGDQAYHRLRLAFATGVGEVALRGLAESGVAAIGVDRVASPFRATYGDESVGQVRSTGLVLLGSGGVGTVQHVDLFL